MKRLRTISAQGIFQAGLTTVQNMAKQLFNNFSISYKFIYQTNFFQKIRGKCPLTPQNDVPGFNILLLMISLSTSIKFNKLSLQLLRRVCSNKSPRPTRSTGLTTLALKNLFHQHPILFIQCIDPCHSSVSIFKSTVAYVGLCCCILLLQQERATYAQTTTYS